MAASNRRWRYFALGLEIASGIAIYDAAITFPGLSMPFGSSADFRVLIKLTSVSLRETSK